MDDYTALARVNLDAANGKRTDQALGMVTAAQVYATLALMEQVKRIADQGCEK